MDLKGRVLSGIKWSVLSRVLIQAVNWGCTIFVIRILNPSDYGLLAMAGVFMSLLQYLNQGGIGLAVITAAEVSRRELRQAFGLVVVVNTTLFATAFLAAPLVAAFFVEPRLVSLVQVLAVQFLVSMFTSIPGALLSRRLDFKSTSLLELLGTVAHAGSTLALAIHGFEVWSLVLGSLIGGVVHAIGLLVVSPLPGTPSFDLRGAGRFVRVGGHAVAARLISFGYLQGDALIGGRVMGKDLLGLYAIALEFASIPVQKVSAVLNPIATAAFSRVQGDLESFRRNLLRASRALFLFSLPVSWGMSCTAEEIVPVLLGEKWSAAILPLKILCLVVPLRLLATFVNSANMGMGRADIVTRCALLTAAVMLAAFAVGAQWGPVGLASAWGVGFPVAFVVTMWMALPSTGLHPRQLATSAAPVIAAGSAMYAGVTVARLLLAEALHPAIRLVALVAVGAAIFVALTWAFNRGGVRDAFRLIRR